MTYFWWLLCRKGCSFHHHSMDANGGPDFPKACAYDRSALKQILIDVKKAES